MKFVRIILPAALVAILMVAGIASAESGSGPADKRKPNAGLRTMSPGQPLLPAPTMQGRVHLDIAPRPAIARVMVTNSPISPPRNGRFAPGEIVQFTLELASTPARATSVNLIARGNNSQIAIPGLPASILVGSSLPFTNFTATAPTVGAMTGISVSGYYDSPTEQIPQVAVFNVDPSLTAGNDAPVCSGTPVAALYISPSVVHPGDAVSFRLSVPCKPQSRTAYRVRRIDNNQRVVDPPNAVNDAEGNRNGMMAIAPGFMQTSGQVAAGGITVSTLTSFTAQALTDAGVPTGPVSGTASVNVIP